MDDLASANQINVRDEKCQYNIKRNFCIFMPNYCYESDKDSRELLANTAPPMVGMKTF